ncbi:MAG TPA: murein L,D-transpeptidase catalytic domain family protein [Candidatus Polarisedimenticolaceae bacterium]|nr:murein L,D-transpeptidase catalytic domain family protein [Candidatus Polarisedimenticolaceae bacterium]
MHPAPAQTLQADPCGLEAELLHAAPTIRPEALLAALSSWERLDAEGQLARPLLTVIDYGLSSSEKRMWVFDLASRQLLFHELVAHGKNSGGDLATAFSNEAGSFMTSLGAFVTGGTYDGVNGYSLRLRGTDPGMNDRAEERAIVVHGAPYVDTEVARKLGRLGRSHGCPALRPTVARPLIDEIKSGTLLYAYHPSLAAPEMTCAPQLAVVALGATAAP